ncbi:ATP-binding protein, partial [Planctomycetota bacterium]
MRPLLLFVAMFGITGRATTVRPGTNPALADLHNQPLSTLEQRLGQLDAQLSLLAHYSLRSGIGTVGYRSATHNRSTHTEWIHIELSEEGPIDQIVLVPTIWRDTDVGFKDDGFPLEFNIFVGTNKDPNGAMVASFGPQDRLLPRIAPLIIPCSKPMASWVRVEATALSPRAWDGLFVLQLSEILVFSGEENIALGQSVKTSPGSYDSTARKRQALVDGFVPYLMNAAQGDQSIAFVSTPGIGDQPTLTIDLGTIHPLNRLHLHATDLSDTVPTSTPAGFGIPKRLLVEGATHPDYSDVIPLVDYRNSSVFDTGPIIMRRFPETPCRYVRFIAVEPYMSIADPNKSQIAFAEIELFSKGQNIALEKPMRADFEVENQNRSFSALTDGRNLYGQILPIRAWLNELAHRHDLEAERPLLLLELSRRYARQKSNLRLMSWLTALLAAGILFTILVDRIIRMRQLTRMKERFAADLHDELGANLHTIGLLGDLAKEAVDSPDELVE